MTDPLIDFRLSLLNKCFEVVFDLSRCGVRSSSPARGGGPGTCVTRMSRKNIGNVGEGRYAFCEYRVSCERANCSSLQAQK